MVASSCRSRSLSPCAKRGSRQAVSSFLPTLPLLSLRGPCFRLRLFLFMVLCVVCARRLARVWLHGHVSIRHSSQAAGTCLWLGVSSLSLPNPTSQPRSHCHTCQYTRGKPLLSPCFTSPSSPRPLPAAAPSAAAPGSRDRRRST